MEEYELAGMLAANPINIYYLTNTVPVGVGMRKEYLAFATLPRDQKEPTFLVTTTLQTWEVGNGDRWTPEVIRYTGPTNWRDYTGEDSLPTTQEPIAAARSPKILDEAALTERERGWVESGNTHSPSPTPEWALYRAMKESGITRGRVAVDDMRIAGISNRDAAMATIAGLKVGMTLPEIQQRFLAEAAARAMSRNRCCAPGSNIQRSSAPGVKPFGRPVVPLRPFLSVPTRLVFSIPISPIAMIHPGGAAKT